MRKRKEAVRFEIDRESGRPFYEQVQDQFINMLHFGAIAPGSRLPTVRQLAEDGGINLKTAFKIYRAMGKAGLVEIRPQSGVFVRSGRGKMEQVYRKSVTEFLDRVETEAGRLNLTTRRLVHLLGLRKGNRSNGSSKSLHVTCAVLECNREQTQMFALEIERKLGVKAEPVEIFSATPPANAARVLREADFFVTTDFHWEEGARVAQRYRKKILRLRLDPKFLQLILTSARKGPFAMIVTDTSIQERFRQSFLPYLKPNELDRIRMVHPDDRVGIDAVNRAGGRVYVSPLCEEQVRPLLDPSLVIVKQQNMIATDSLRELKEDLLFYPLGSK
jgi:GntR family transcriptional regulator